MTLLEIANAAALRFVRQDAATLELAKAYVRQRYSMLWDAHNWRQSLTTTTVAVPAATAEVDLGSSIERVLAVRWNSTVIDGIDAGTALRLLPETFDQAGDPIGYIELPNTATNSARLRLVQVPQEAGTLYVLGKLRCPGLPVDTSTPLLAGISSGLMSYALGDLWSYEGQESKAGAKYSEAGQIATAAIGAELTASGVRPRLIPYAGIADDLCDF